MFYAWNIWMSVCGRNDWRFIELFCSYWWDDFYLLLMRTNFRLFISFACRNNDCFNIVSFVINFLPEYRCIQLFLLVSSIILCALPVDGIMFRNFLTRITTCCRACRFVYAVYIDVHKSTKFSTTFDQRCKKLTPARNSIMAN